LNFLLSGVTVAVGWSGYFCGLLLQWGVHVPDAFAMSPLRFDHDHRLRPTGAIFALIMTGLAHYTTLGGAQPMISALANAGSGLSWTIPIVSFGIVFGIAAAPIGSMYAQSRILFAMAEDGLLPDAFAAVHPRFKTPHRATAWVGSLGVAAAGILPLDLLGELVSIGTLLAFVIVCASVLILRKREPGIRRPFRVPASPYVPAFGILICVYMMASLPADTWIRLAIWLVVGLLLYALFGYRNSRAAKGRAQLLE
jgi:basic amino acid/polyamine antiporter, APA family